jgi:hypothetical protein
MAINWVESAAAGSVNRSCRVRRTLASSLLIGWVSLNAELQAAIASTIRRGFVI